MSLLRSGAADGLEAINPDGPVDKFPKSMLKEKQPLTASRHIMDQAFFKARLEQANMRDTVILKQKLADYKQVAIWTIEELKDKNLTLLLEDVYKLTILVLNVFTCTTGYSEERCFSDSDLARFAIYKLLQEQDPRFFAFIGKEKAETLNAFSEELCKDIEVSSLNYLESNIDQDIVSHTVHDTSLLICAMTFGAQEYVKRKHCVYLTNKHLSALMTKLNTKEQSVKMSEILNNGAKPADNEALGSYIQHEVQKQLKKAKSKAASKHQKKLRKNSSAPEKDASGKPTKNGRHGKKTEQKGTKKTPTPANPRTKKRTPKKVTFTKTPKEANAAPPKKVRKGKGQGKTRVVKRKDTRASNARS